MIGKKWLAIGAAVVTAGAGMIAISSAGANIPGSNFQGNDGNQTSQGQIDWQNAPNLSVGVDTPSGQLDNAFTQGSKNDDVNVVIDRGSVPNNKADIGRFATAHQTGATGDVFMYLAWVRNNLSGTTNFDFEINKNPQPNMIPPTTAPMAVTLNRTVGDLLINYDIQGGAQNPTLTLRRWTGTAWDAGVTLGSAIAEGRINGTGIGPIQNFLGGPATIPQDQFGEASINLTAAGVIPNQNDPNAPCVGFGSAYVKSRSSDSFPAALKDFIAPIPLNLNNCGKVIIRKETVPNGATQVFTYDHTVVNAPVIASPFQLIDGGSQQFPSVKLNQAMSVTENVPAGWILSDTDCSASTGVTVSEVGAVLSFTLDNPADVVDCTYTNTQQGTITVNKHTDPVGGLGQSFEFDPSYGANFSLLDGESNTSGALDPGNYSVAEIVPTGWDLTEAICDDDDGTDPASIVLDAGENITCDFTNTARGNIVIVKQTDPDGSTDTFSFSPSYGAPFDLTDGQQNDSGPLVPGIFSVSETVPGGWDLIESVCSDGSDVSAIDVGPGETVTCVFTNQQDANIIVFKVTDPAGDPQLFDFVSDFAGSFQLADGGHVDSGDLDPGTYSVSETVPTGWQLTSATCTDGSDPASISLQAGETVGCTFNNQKDGGIIVRKETERDEPGSFAFVTSYPPGGFNLSDGQSNNSGLLDPGSYSVAETVPPNWQLVSAVCSDGSAPATISLQAGETVTCTFTNRLLVGAIKIHKDRKHVADGPGDSPHAGVDFTVNGQTVTTDGNGDACVDGLFFGPYTVHEITPAGYADQVDQNVTVDNVAYCEDPFVGEPVLFVNVPLTDVQIGINSQVSGGTQTTIRCTAADGTVYEEIITGDGDGGLNLPDLPPTAPDVATLNCDIFIDP